MDLAMRVAVFVRTRGTRAGPMTILIEEIS
jgi:hypothetical protein